MFLRRLTGSSLTKKIQLNLSLVPKKYINVTLTGAVNDVGANVAFLLKQNPRITQLNIYDDDSKVKGIGFELAQIPIGPPVSAFSGDHCLPFALQSADLVLIVSRVPQLTKCTREDMLSANAIGVQRICRSLADINSEAFIAISTSPINCIVPFVAALMHEYNSYNPQKLCGITEIDSSRSKSFAANLLKVNAEELYVPVVGGHSEDTIVPLYSNMTPSHYKLNHIQAGTLTRLVRKAGYEVLSNKYGADSSTVGTAWSINEFVNKLVRGLAGETATVHCYTSNTNYGSRFFAGPTTVGPDGIISTCTDLSMNVNEKSLVDHCVPYINDHVLLGENFLRRMENTRKY